MAPLPVDRVARIQDRLLRWFEENGRDLPWRRTRDPYAILVSEVMLQQTQVDRVVPYYEQFLARYPTVQELAAAPTADIIRLWSGLGYNRRAVNLQRAARAIVNDYDGVLPRDPALLRRLPGVGAYTAGAIAAFAFEQDVTFLDTNMRRVVARLTIGSEEHGAGAVEQAVQDSARQLLPPGQSWQWNQALMEFGALQCTARRPNCILCPLQTECAAFPTMQSALAARRTSSRAKRTEPFATSTRFFRGRIVEELRALPRHEQAGIELGELGPKLREGFGPEDMPWLTSLVERLERDGLVVISEEMSIYDVGQPGTPKSSRVRLP